MKGLKRISSVRATHPWHWVFNFLAGNYINELVPKKNYKYISKRPMGHIAHLRKQFKSINTYDYIITLIKRIKKTLLTSWDSLVLHLNNLESPSPQDALCQVGLKLAHAVRFWRRRFLNYVNVFSLFRNYLPFEKGGALQFFFIQGCFVPSLVEIGSVVREKIFKFCHSIPTIPKLSPLGKGRDPSFEQTWISFTQGCFVSSLFEIGKVVLEKKIKMWKVYRRTDRQTRDEMLP